MSHKTIYLFEANSIQRYVLDSAKLRDMVGASELLEDFWGDIQKNVISQLNISGKVQFPRCSGGALTAVFDDTASANQFRDLWSLVVQQKAPDLDFAHTIIKENNGLLSAIHQGNNRLRELRNQQRSSLPIAGPLVARYPRTGGPAIQQDPDTNEYLDRTTYQKRAYVPRDHKPKAKPSALIRKFTANDSGIPWPVDLEKSDEDNSTLFPFINNNQYIGIVHADGNALGKLISQIRDGLKGLNNQQYIDAFKEFSAAIDSTTIEAARAATKTTLLAQAQKHGVWPARPVVLGGDDLTMIVRGDLTIAFTQCFIEQFEKCSTKHLANLKAFLLSQISDTEALANFPEQLTACAGIAFVKSKQPFYLAYELAESLCQHAKTVSKRQDTEKGEIPSSLAFHRITTSSIDSYEEIVQHELTIEQGANESFITTLQPYAIGQISSELPQLKQLRSLQNLLSEKTTMSRGPTRQLMTMLQLDIPQAKDIYQRWRINLPKTKGYDEHLQKFDQLINDLTKQPIKELPFGKIEEQRYATPLGDIFALNAVEGTTND